MSGLISVIVPVYNAAPYLRACIESVLCQTHPDFELILTDDGSTVGKTRVFGFIHGNMAGFPPRETPLLNRQRERICFF